MHISLAKDIHTIRPFEEEGLAGGVDIARVLARIQGLELVRVLREVVSSVVVAIAEREAARACRARASSCVFFSHITINELPVLYTNKTKTLLIECGIYDQMRAMY